MSAIGARPPRIGLSAYRETAAWGVWNEPADLLPASYADSVAQAGGAPMLLPAPAGLATASLESLAAAVVDGLDGLLLSGGPDLDPARYGAERHFRTGPAYPERDDWETALVHLVLDQDKPLLAVCRGMQVLNVALGGTLIQHVPEVVGNRDHSPGKGVHGRHVISTAPGTRIAQIHGAQAEVATYHHQSLGQLAAGLVPTAWTSDGIIEAAELEGSSWVTAVQWHPEVVNGGDLFSAFVDACVQSAATARSRHANA